MLARAAGLEVGRPVAVQVFRAGVEPEGQRADATHHQVMLVGLLQPHGDVGLPHRKAQLPWVRDQLDHDVGIGGVQGGKGWRQDMRGHGLRAGHAHEAGEARVAAAHVALQQQRRLLQSEGLIEHILAGKRRQVALGCTVQQPDTEICLK